MAIFPKIDGANICPGLNCEESGAVINQALVFFFCGWLSGWEALKAVIKSCFVLVFFSLSFLHREEGCLQNASLWLMQNQKSVRKCNDDVVGALMPLTRFFEMLFSYSLITLREMGGKKRLKKTERKWALWSEEEKRGGLVVDWTNRVHKRVHHLARQMLAPFTLWDPAERSCAIKDGLVPMARGKEGAKEGGPSAKFSASGIRSASRGAKWPS